MKAESLKLWIVIWMLSFTLPIIVIGILNIQVKVQRIEAKCGQR